MNVIREALGRNVRQYGIVGALIVIVLFFQWQTDGRLLMPNNLAALVQQNAYVMILAIGMVAVIVAGHIDLSVGSVVAFIGGLTAIMLAHWGWPVPVAIVAALAVGALVGCWHGFWIAYVGIPAFIVTLAGMLLFRGLAIVLVGQTVATGSKTFNQIGNGSLPNVLGFVGNIDVVTIVIGAVAIVGLVISQFRARRAMISHGLHTEAWGAFVAKNVVMAVLIGLVAWRLSLSHGGTPIILIIVGALILGFTFVLNRTRFGRHVYAVGGNRNAAILSGVDTRRTDFQIFVNMGLLAAVAAIATTARAGSGVAAAGQNFELDAIAACFIGGTAVTGGVGRISGAMVGALIMGVLNMGLSIMRVDSAWQMAIKGLVLLAAVALDIVSKRRGALV
ncbi:inner-membrane translocator [Xylanimonas cellulosilytica DSM 15894]|uniref:Xylose transport system permease protein XylH n=1 Tax=Xylanimonas cellulosilytica (strain DSM 15894 / JCM 12276 / CECT 5975 / KCTC 9989 / LMG 20990 / NBRC 107835 / XIL07) TaxID=446471 RepID=D1BXI2_XYLCX|nr:multiple monosaccharide ABC transporter permease [Xylanimonas cellulosilytica]ACZ29792.1 inner-membrane translocator [Xylanimonas cellulosilytica DSM 15894]